MQKHARLLPPRRPPPLRVHEHVHPARPSQAYDNGPATPWHQTSEPGGQYGRASPTPPSPSPPSLRPLLDLPRAALGLLLANITGHGDLPSTTKSLDTMTPKPRVNVAATRRPDTSLNAETTWTASSCVMTTRDAACHR